MAISEERLLPASDHGRVSLPHALLTASIPPLAVGFTLGITYGNIGGALEEEAFLDRYHHPADGVLQGLAAAMQIGCVIGSIFASWSTDRFGRRRSTLFSVSLVALASMVLTIPAVFPSSDSVLPIVAGRFLSGTGGGLACACVPLHVSEVAPAAYRGGIEASFQLAIEVGILFSYLLNFAVTGTSYGWMLSLACSLPPALLFVLWALLSLPESPRYLVLHGREAEAVSVLNALRTPADDVAAEVVAIRNEVCDPRAKQGSSWAELVRPRVRGKVAVAMAVLILQVGTGIDFITVYAPRIFSQIANATATAAVADLAAGSADAGNSILATGTSAAASGSSSIGSSTLLSPFASATPYPGNGPELLYTVYVGLTFVVVTPFAIAAVDRCGRRWLLLLGGAGMTLSLGGLAAAYAALQGQQEHAYAITTLASSSASAEGASSALPVLCIFLVLSYVACFSFSWGPVAWVIPSEMIPYQLRAKVVAAGTVANWLADYAVVGSFLSLNHAVGEAGSFAIFAAINALAFAFVLLCVPETKGLGIEEASRQPHAGEAPPHQPGTGGVVTGGVVGGGEATAGGVPSAVASHGGPLHVQQQQQQQQQQVL